MAASGLLPCQALPGQLRSLDNSEKRPSDRLLYPGTCRKVISHYSAKRDLGYLPKSVSDVPVSGHSMAIFADGLGRHMTKADCHRLGFLSDVVRSSCISRRVRRWDLLSLLHFEVQIASCLSWQLICCDLIANLERTDIRLVSHHNRERFE